MERKIVLKKDFLNAFKKVGVEAWGWAPKGTGRFRGQMIEEDRK